MVKKCFVLHEEVINLFHNKFRIPTIEKLPFHLACVRIIGSMDCGKTGNMFLHGNAFKNKYKVKERLCRKIQQNNWYRNKNQHWGGKREVLMEGIVVEYFFN